MIRLKFFNNLCLFLKSEFLILGIVWIIPFGVFSQEAKFSEETKQLKYYLEKSESMMDINLDSAFYYNEKANKLMLNSASDQDKIKVYNNYGSIFLAQGNFVKSLEYYLKTKKIIESNLLSYPNNQEYIELRLEILIHLGVAYLKQENFDQSLSYFNEAMLYLENRNLADKEKELNFKMKILNNTAVIFTKKKEFDKALEFYTSARKLIEGKGDKKTEASLLNNIGICHLEKKKYTLSAFFFEQALQIRESLNDRRGIAQCYNNLGKNYALNKNYGKAKNYFQKALALGKGIGNTESILYSLESLTALYREVNDYQNAYSYFSELTNLKDSLFNAETVKHIAQLEMSHKLEKQKELFDLDLKRKEAEKQKAKLTYYIIGGSLFFLLAIAGLFIYLQKTKIKNIELSRVKLQLEHKNISLEKEKLQEEIAYQNREITAKVMYLLKKNELINAITEKLIDLKKNSKTDNQKIIQEMIIEMRTKKDSDIWNEFETHFTKVHPEFYTKLNELFPNLTPGEKKLCAFLKLNMTTKDISAITYQSLNSITVSRTRLRKKLNINGEDTNLTNFLASL